MLGCLGHIDVVHADSSAANHLCTTAAFHRNQMLFMQGAEWGKNAETHPQPRESFFFSLLLKMITIQQVFTLSFFPAAMMSAVTLVADRTTSPSY